MFVGSACVVDLYCGQRRREHAVKENFSSMTTKTSQNFSIVHKVLRRLAGRYRKKTWNQVPLEL